MSQLKVHVYAHRSGTNKNGKAYVLQQCEVLQSPDAPNVTYTLFHRDESKVREPGTYAVRVRFYADGDKLTPSFYDYRKVQ